MNKTLGTTLDISQEKKKLLHQITVKEIIFSQLSAKKQHLTTQVEQFEKLYNKKIKSLYDKLHELDRILFKYRNISEYVDDFLSFKEAERIFEETMNETKDREEEKVKREKKKLLTKDNTAHLSIQQKKELKKLYRELARKFHPDKTGGNDQIMILINEAYQNGNITALKNLELEHDVKIENNTFNGLTQKLVRLTQRIEKVSNDIHAIKTSHLYKLRTKLLKTNTSTKTLILDMLTKKLTNDVRQKEREVEDFMKKFTDY